MLASPLFLCSDSQKLSLGLHKVATPRMGEEYFSCHAQAKGGWTNEMILVLSKVFHGIDS